MLEFMCMHNKVIEVTVYQGRLTHTLIEKMLPWPHNVMVCTCD